MYINVLYVKVFDLPIFPNATKQSYKIPTGLINDHITNRIFVAIK